MSSWPSLHVESDDQLEQHTRYLLVVTRSVLDESGKHVKVAKEFWDLGRQRGRWIGRRSWLIQVISHGIQDGVNATVNAA